MRIIISVALLSLCFSNAVCQTHPKPKTSSLPDTIETYSVSLSATYGGEVARYYVNGKEVEKRIYDRYRIPVEKATKCHPCIQKNYNVDNELISITTQYGPDCLVGSIITFYPKGKIKMRGQYQQKTSVNGSNLSDHNYCSIPEGKWYYYSSMGDIIKVETYVEGKLVNTE